MSDAAACAGIVAAAHAIQEGQARGLPRHEIAHHAHEAAQRAHDLASLLDEHAGLDDDSAEDESLGMHLSQTFDAVDDAIAENQPIVGQTEHHRALARVGHGHGGHGGHHLHGFYGGGDWYDGAWAWPIVLGCGPGQVLLADGTCFPPAAYGVNVVQPVVAGEALAPPSGHHVVPFDEHGHAHLPDGLVLDASQVVVDESGTSLADAIAHHSLHYPFVGSGGPLAPSSVGAPFMPGSNIGPVMSPQDSSGQGYTVGPGGSTVPYPAAGASGQQTSGNATADALNLQWVALASVVPSCLGPNPSLPNSLAPDVFSSTWQDDLAGWQNFYAGIGSFGTEDLTGDLTGWQAYANAWGQYVVQTCPNQPLPANFPSGTAGLAGVLPSITSLNPGSVASALEWGVIAVAVGVGLWLFWPILVGAKGAIAAL